MNLENMTQAKSLRINITECMTSIKKLKKNKMDKFSGFIPFLHITIRSLCTIPIIYYPDPKQQKQTQLYPFLHRGVYM